MQKVSVIKPPTRVKKAPPMPLYRKCVDCGKAGLRRQKSLKHHCEGPWANGVGPSFMCINKETGEYNRPESQLSHHPLRGKPSFNP